MKTGVEYRFEAKQRVEKFKKNMAEKGYKNMTFFVGEELREELDILKKEKGLNRQQALEYIFEKYKSIVTGNETSNPSPKDIKKYREWLFLKIKDLKENNSLTFAQIAEELNKEDLQTTQGNKWGKNTVKSFFGRYK